MSCHMNGMSEYQPGTGPACIRGRCALSTCLLTHSKEDCLMKTIYPAGMMLVLALLTGRLPAQTYDDFTSSSLNPVWSWVRESPSNWSLVAGYLTIVTERGALTTGRFNNVQNILLQDVPDEDVIRMETKLLFSPESWLHNAGLIYYIDDDNYIRVSRGMYPDDDGIHYNGVWMEWEQNGVTLFHFVNDIRSDTTWLRLTCAYDTVFHATYSIDGTTWLDIGRESLTFTGGSARAGLQAANGDGLGVMGRNLPAHFDYFGMEPTGIRQSALLPSRLAIVTVYPHPLTSEEHAVATIRLGRADLVRWYFTDMLGRRFGVSQAHGRLQPGLHHITFSLRDVPAGVYFLHVAAGNTLAVQSILLTR